MADAVPGILRRILADKKGEVARAKLERSLSCPQDGRAGRAEDEHHRKGDVPRADGKGFADALSGGRISLIAEIKRTSPSKGELVEDFSPLRRARDYESAGAAAISVLTDAKYFGGRLKDLRGVRGAVGLPLLRKDFIIDPYQVYEARAAGADAVLLIAAALDGILLRDLAELCTELGMDPLFEIHDERELEKVLRCEPGSFVGRPLVGINNRDLHTFRVDLGVTEGLMPQIPDECTVVSESGISKADDVSRLEALGVDAILVGEALMRAVDPRDAIARMLPHLVGGEA